MGSSIRSAVRCAAWLACALASVSNVAGAQHAARTPTSARPNASVSGRVETPGDKSQLPVAGVVVTLHRVGQDSSGAVDSVRTSADGRYSISYSRSDTGRAIYFAAAVYRGIAYFSAPLSKFRASGDDGAITVFDTTTRAIGFHVQGHHLVVASPRPDGVRDVVEVWELSNDTSVTVLGKDSLSPVWTASLPEGATKFAGGQGDVSADALVQRGNRVALIAPFGPGIKQLSYTYSLASSRFPMVVSLEQPNTVLEVLVEEQTATVTSPSLRAMPAATSQGRTFKRFLGQDVPKGEEIRIAVPATTAVSREVVLEVLAGAIAVMMALSLWRALSRKHGPPTAPAVVVSEADSLAAAIVELDARHARHDETLPEAEYVLQRAALKARLGALLASNVATV